MKTMNKYYLLAFLLLSEITMFAQPGSDNGSGGVEGDDPSPTPIDGKLIILMIFGIFFAYYIFKQRKSIFNK